MRISLVRLLNCITSRFCADMVQLEDEFPRTDFEAFGTRRDSGDDFISDSPRQVRKGHMPGNACSGITEKVVSQRHTLWRIISRSSVAKRTDLVQRCIRPRRWNMWWHRSRLLRHFHSGLSAAGVAATGVGLSNSSNGAWLYCTHLLLKKEKRLGLCLIIR